VSPADSPPPPLTPDRAASDAPGDGWAGAADGAGRPPRAVRYAAALVLAAVALAATVLLSPAVPRAPFVLPFAAVVIAAWYGGTGPGLVAGLASVLGVDYFLIAPPGRIDATDAHDYLAMAAFLSVSWLVGRLTESLRTAREAAARRGDDAQRAAADLGRANHKLREQAAALAAQAETLHSTVAQLAARTEDAEEARRAAQAQAARAAEVLEGTTDAYFALDGEFRVVAVNGAMERATGIPRDDLLGRPFWELFPAARGTAFEHHYRRVASTASRRTSRTTTATAGSSWWSRWTPTRRATEASRCSGATCRSAYARPRSASGCSWRRARRSAARSAPAATPRRRGAWPRARGGSSPSSSPR
jgi:PAS domain S-box-containing protein